MLKYLKFFGALFLVLFILNGCGPKVITKDTIDVSPSDFPLSIYPNSFNTALTKEIRLSNDRRKKYRRTSITCYTQMRTNDPFEGVKNFYMPKSFDNMDVFENNEKKLSYFYHNPENKNKYFDDIHYPVTDLCGKRIKIFPGDYSFDVAQFADFVNVGMNVYKAITPEKVEFNSDLFYLKIRNYPYNKTSETLTKSKTLINGNYFKYKGDYFAWSKDNFNKIRNYYYKELKKICTRSFQEKYENNYIAGEPQNYNIYGTDDKLTKYYISVSTQKDKYGRIRIWYTVETD